MNDELAGKIGGNQIIKIDGESWFRVLMSFSWGEKRIYAVFARLVLGMREIACIEKDYEIYMRALILSN